MPLPTSATPGPATRLARPRPYLARPPAAAARYFSCFFSSTTSAWADVLRAVGAPPTEPVVLVRIGHATWPALGLEALLTSSAEATLTPDAVVIGAGATAGVDLAGPVLPGDVRAAVVLALGPAPEAYGGRSYYPSGLAIEWDEADRARRVGVVAAYQLAPDPPPMQPAQEAP